MTRLIATLLPYWLVVMAMLTTVANAEDREETHVPLERKHYIDLHVGAQLPVPVEVRMLNSAVPGMNGTGGMLSDASAVLAFNHGTYLNDRLHMELGVAHGQFRNLNMDLDRGFIGNPERGTNVPVNGRMEFFSTTATILYDLEPINERITPFVALGGTVAYVRQRNVGRQGGAFLVSDSDVMTALCFIAGANIKINERTDLSLRYTGILRSGTEFTERTAMGTFGSRMPGGLDHALSVGFRYYYQ